MSPRAAWRDPTYGRIDRDIQEAVDEWGPASTGQRVAVENTLQERRDRGDEPLLHTRTSPAPPADPLWVRAIRLLARLVTP